MKRAYTTFVPYLRGTCKKYGKTPKEIVNALAALAKASNDDRCCLEYGGSYMEKAILDGRAVHIFLPDDEFCDWLVSCVKDLTACHALTVKQLLGSKSVGCFHFPAEGSHQSYAFDFLDQKGMKDAAGTPVKADPTYGLFMLTWPANDPQKRTSLLVSTNADYKSDPKAAPYVFYLKLIVGLGMYLDCFPEAMRTGPPDDLKHPSHHQYNTEISVSASPKIYGTHESPVAHFRRGHFRVLSSERFTNKRWQTVFVHETFVGGKSKTVLSPEQVDNETDAMLRARETGR